MYNVKNLDTKDFLNNLNDMDQQEKFQYLIDFLTKMKFNFDINKDVSNTLAIVNGFFSNRSKWQELIDLHENLVEIGIRLKQTNLSFHNLITNNIEIPKQDFMYDNKNSEKSEKKIHLNSK